MRGRYYENSSRAPSSSAPTAASDHRPTSERLQSFKKVVPRDASGKIRHDDGERVSCRRSPKRRRPSNETPRPGGNGLARRRPVCGRANTPFRAHPGRRNVEYVDLGAMLGHEVSTMRRSSASSGLRASQSTTPSVPPRPAARKLSRVSSTSLGEQRKRDHLTSRRQTPASWIRIPTDAHAVLAAIGVPLVVHVAAMGVVFAGAAHADEWPALNGMGPPLKMPPGSGSSRRAVRLEDRDGGRQLVETVTESEAGGAWCVGWLRRGPGSRVREMVLLARRSRRSSPPRRARVWLLRGFMHRHRPHACGTRFRRCRSGVPA